MTPHPPPAPVPAPAPAAAPELPFDPWRLAGGLLARWRWIVAGALLGALVGLGVSLLRASTRYEVALRLIRREIPASFRVGEIGEAFKPRQINNATLIGAALSDNVLGRVAAKAEPPVSAGLLRISVDAREQRGTEFVLLTVSGYHSREATVALANLWGQEIVEFSREIQTRESREVRTYLQQQVEATDADLTRVGEQILEISRREGIIDAAKQIDASLRSLGDLDLRYETVRIDLQTTEFRLRSLEQEFARQNPAREKLGAAQRELDEALVRYTEQNPQVRELRARVEALRRDAAAAEGAPVDTASAASTELGHALYLQLVDLRAQREAAALQLGQLDKLRQEARGRLDAIPAKSAQVARLLQTKASLEMARNLLFARLREAQLFEERAPGYFQVFSPAAPEGVLVRPKWLKLLAFMAVGLVGGLGAAAATAVAAELMDSRLRTAAEARRLLRAPVWAELPRGADAVAWRAAVERIWLHWVSQRPAGQPLAVWTPVTGPAEEAFWRAIVAEGARLFDGFLIVDAGEEPGPAFAGLAADGADDSGSGVRVLRLDPGAGSINEVRERAADLARRHGSRPVCCRFSGPVREPGSTLARACAPALVVVLAESGRLAYWEEQARLHATGVKPPAGLVVADAPDLLRPA